ncbi:hypothetical protein GOP47_0001916 [Adiantum capillus-veneris]|uniref:Uncharacterized protein n=1 Tax=Adiantum capillus-veneris TaxID=13818 RepID=A0A9D4VAN4_ADICA|nr:hypothetical protein GOP47_0001916 [Adiantum capillus-veneris]
MKEELPMKAESAVKENYPERRGLISTVESELVDSPISVSEDEVVSEGSDTPLITEEMLKEEERLEEMRAKEDADKELKKNFAPEVAADTMFDKLEKLLCQTELYSQFLFEKMDDFALEPTADQDVAEMKSCKRKAADLQTMGEKKAKVVMEAMLANCNEEPTAAEESCLLTEEEKAWKEQQELVPLLVGGRLKPYQLKGIKWMISLWLNGLNGILADQMGLGKTVQTIGLLAHLKGKGLHGPFLVCAPLSTLSNWVNEIKRFVPSMDVLMYHGSKNVRMALRRERMPATITASFPVIVTSYEVAMNDRPFLADFKWKYIVVDEGHRLKNFDCKLLKELKQMPADNTLLLTGTPLQNNLPELWSLLNFILPQIFASLEEFQTWFEFADISNNPTQEEDTNDLCRLKVISKLHLILRPFLLRRLKEDVEKSLPLKKEIILYAPMSEQQREFHYHLINKTMGKYLKEIVQLRRFVRKAILKKVFLQLRKNCNHPNLVTSQFATDKNWPPIEKLVKQCGKLKLLDRLLDHLRERGHKVLIFSQWTKVLDILQHYLEERGFNPFRIDGSVPQAERQRQIEDFNQGDSKNFIFILSTRAGGLGINLTSADTAIMYDSDWNPHMDMQAMDRCHRIGQTRPVHVYRLVTSHSVECRMLKVAADKLKLEHLVIEKGQFRQERDHPKITLQEADLLALVEQERDEEEELVQSAEISEENLIKLLDRSELVNKQSEVTGSSAKLETLRLKGPGWEVVIRSGKSNLLSSIEG